MEQSTTYVGIDVSKDGVDVAVPTQRGQLAHAL